MGGKARGGLDEKLDAPMFGAYSQGKREVGMKVLIPDFLGQFMALGDAIVDGVRRAAGFDLAMKPFEDFTPEERRVYERAAKEWMEAQEKAKKARAERDRLEAKPKARRFPLRSRRGQKPWRRRMAT